MAKEPVSVSRFREYLRIKSVQPDPDYAGCVSFLKKYSEELGLEFQSIEEHWTHDPFSAHKDEEGNIFARGSQDMKCVGIQYLEAIRQLKDSGKTFLRTIHVTFSSDEEISGTLGMGKFVQHEALKKLNHAFSLDEGLAFPDDTYRVYYAERNMWWLKVKCEGSPGHGSKFIENTAAEKLQRVINSFMDFREIQKRKLEKDSSLNLGDVISVNMTKLEGGVQINVVPAQLSVCFDMRVPPTVDKDELMGQIDSWLEEAGPGVTSEWLVWSWIPHMTPTDKSDPWWNAFSGVLDTMGLKYKTEIFSAGTDARYLRKLGFPALGFSPMIHTPQLLHDHNEFLNEKIFLDGIDIYLKMIPALANVPRF